MQDVPTAAELIEAIAAFIRKSVMPQLKGDTQFHARVAANALDLVKRELTLSPTTHAAEHKRLKDLLGEDGSLESLNRALSARIANGALSLDNPKLTEHLWQTTLEKLAVDQPTYSAYRRTREEEA